MFLHRKHSTTLVGIYKPTHTLVGRELEPGHPLQCCVVELVLIVTILCTVLFHRWVGVALLLNRNRCDTFLIGKNKKYEYFFGHSIGIETRTDGWVWVWVWVCTLTYTRFESMDTYDFCVIVFQMSHDLSFRNLRVWTFNSLWSLFY